MHDYCDSLLRDLRKYVASLALVGWLGGCTTAQQHMSLPTNAFDSYQPLKLTGDQVKNGRFDVTVEYGDDGVGWLVYSIVEIPSRVSTHLAKSVDHGASWQHVSVINPVEEATVEINGKTITGLWRNETPTLAYDPGDRGREWKLFWHKYFVKPPYEDKHRLFEQGWIAYRYASRPEGPWSEEIRLIGSESVGAKIDIKRLLPNLDKVLFLMEPGVIAHEGMLYMCADICTTDSSLGDWLNRKIILLASRDHGESWEYVGALTNGDDAKDFGYAAFTGSSLVRDQGKLYLLITPSGSSSKKNRGHDGTIIVEIVDINKAQVMRDAQGHIQPVKYLSAKYTMGGLADYHEQNFNGGIIMPQINLKTLPEVFQVLSTMEGIQPQAQAPPAP